MKFIKTDKQSCHENWNEMLPEDKGKFCTKCSTKVIDFTGLNTPEILEELENSKEPICARITNTQLKVPLIKYSLKNDIQKLGKLTASIVIASTLTNEISATNIKPFDKASIEYGKNDFKRILEFKGTIFSKTHNRVINNAKIEFITINKIFRTYTNNKGEFSLEIPKELIKQEKNIIKLSFYDIIEPKPKTLEELKNDPCLLCFHEIEILSLSKKELKNNFIFNSTAVEPYLGCSDCLLFGNEIIPLVYYKGNEITWDEFDSKRRKEFYTQIEYFSAKHVKPLCGKENKYGIYICF